MAGRFRVPTQIKERFDGHALAAGFQLGRAPVGEQAVRQLQPAHQVKLGHLVAQAGDACPAGAAAEVDQRRSLCLWVGLASGGAGRL